jgi:PPOX class probable F420-dependent enzyme
MAKGLQGRVRELLKGRNFAQVATVRKDGSPHVTPVWVDVDDGHVVLNSAEGRLWPQLARENPNIEINVQNLENPYEYVSIRGRVDEATHGGADEHIDKLSQKYLGKEQYPFRQPGEQRVMLRVNPERVHHYGG